MKCLSKSCLCLHPLTLSFFRSVLDGPDEPVLEVHPVKPFYVAGDSLNLSCQAEGFPKPTVEWMFGDRTISQEGVLTLTNIHTGEGGVYTCTCLNNRTEEKRSKSTVLKVYGM